jgi:hypothetical protein
MRTRRYLIIYLNNFSKVPLQAQHGLTGDSLHRYPVSASPITRVFLHRYPVSAGRFFSPTVDNVWIARFRFARRESHASSGSRR